MRRLAFLAALVGALIASPALARCDAGERALPMLTLGAAAGSAGRELAEDIQTEFQRSLNGKYCISFVDPGEGGGGAERALERLRSGEVVFALVTFDDLSLTAPLHRVFELPFVFRDMAVVDVFLDDPAAAPLRGWAAPGIRSMALAPFGLEIIAGRKAVLLPPDLAGVRFALNPDQATRPMISRLGATGRVVPEGERQDALQQGAADAEMARVADLARRGNVTMHAVFTQTNHALRGAQVLGAQASLIALPSADEGAVARAVNAGVAFYRKRQDDREKAAAEQVMRSGKPFYLLTQEQRAAWLSSLQPVIAAFAALPGGQAVLDAVERAHALE